MSGKPCPICRRPSTEAYAPFCTKRCADIDLQRWFSGAYAIAASEAEDDAQPPEPDED
ncbi:MAG TPA: DNA gyrase inhibitor YacG [Caulobacteraceae bacterium]